MVKNRMNSNRHLNKISRTPDPKISNRVSFFYWNLKNDPGELILSVTPIEKGSKKLELYFRMLLLRYIIPGLYP